jgi:hypothetical protein
MSCSFRFFKSGQINQRVAYMKTAEIDQFGEKAVAERPLGAILILKGQET